MAKETFNVIQGLETLGLTASQIIAFIKFVETSDPQVLDKLRNTANKTAANETPSKEAFNIIQGLKKLGATDSQIVTFIEYIETSDPKLLDKIPNINTNDNNGKN